MKCFVVRVDSSCTVQIFDVSASSFPFVAELAARCPHVRLNCGRPIGTLTVAFLEDLRFNNCLDNFVNSSKDDNGAKSFT